MVTSFYDAVYQITEAIYATTSYLTYVLNNTEGKTIDLSYNRDNVYGYILIDDKIVEKQLHKVCVDKNNNVKIKFIDSDEYYYLNTSIDIEFIQTTFNIAQSLRDYPIDDDVI